MQRRSSKLELRLCERVGAVPHPRASRQHRRGSRLETWDRVGREEVEWHGGKGTRGRCDMDWEWGRTEGNGGIIRIRAVSDNNDLEKAARLAPTKEMHEISECVVGE
ncbi:hypothetical protein NEOLEDRAFT_1131577 [Neolentinus lepideus HHB14362 ss-1]|uniref:Uncharacterized protein n=1 Tax=Neolentinus lepideus HHB14362 ss-1 TaxID=1314782 RepID=A0A165TR67_9AGAM|nr:hypothetical protein NEOLEDRAFT_1131577 [Neolentinus lepideus HHB14362 ss-1]